MPPLLLSYVSSVVVLSTFTAAPKINTEIKDVAVTCNNLLAHMRSHTTAAVLQHDPGRNDHLLVIPAVEHANKGV